MTGSARELLITTLIRHRPEDEKESADLQRMQRYALELAEPFSRSELEAHFTASAILTEESGTLTCLVFHRKLERWLQPGGHFEQVDRGQMEAAALREVGEETGCAARLVETAPVPLDVDIHAIPAHGAEPAHLHLDLRMLARAGDAMSVQPVEARALSWLTWDEALAIAGDPGLQRALRKARRLMGR
jgi:8-oxo-dGTP pyrophosphatase MutT (NUDIX family)